MLASSSCSSYFMGCSGNSIPKLTMRNCAYALSPEWWGQNGCILKTVSERISGDAHSSGYRGTGEKQTRCLLCMVVQIGGIHHAPAFGKYVWTERQLACFEQILLSSSNFSASLPPSVHLPSSSPLRTCQDSCCMTINPCGWRLVHGGGRNVVFFCLPPSHSRIKGHIILGGWRMKDPHRSTFRPQTQRRKSSLQGDSPYWSPLT